MGHWVVLIALSLPASSQGIQVTVEAGDVDRQDAPVSILLPLPPTAGGQMKALVRSEEGQQPAQVEPTGPGEGRVWWVVSRLSRHQKRDYQIELGADPGTDSFRWQDTPNESMDLLDGSRPVLRYVYRAYDPADVENTKKPFHHVFDPDGSRLITQGLGGKKYPHHRGIFFGYNKCQFDGTSADTWHAAKGEHQVHRCVAATVAGPVLGGHTVAIDWNDRTGKPFAHETRTLWVFRQAPDCQLIEFRSTLRAAGGPVRLDGDPQHAGVQFRAAGEVAEREKESRYLRPAAWSHLPSDQQVNEPGHKDLPWNALQFRLEGRPYTVAYLTDPAHPKDALFSERLYGRFGEFFPWDLSQTTPLSVRYRWWIVAGREVKREEVEGRFQDLASPPKVTRKDR